MKARINVVGLLVRWGTGQCYINLVQNVLTLGRNDWILKIKTIHNRLHRFSDSSNKSSANVDHLLLTIESTIHSLNIK